MTGSIPGSAASTRLTCALGSPPKAVEAPENSLALLVTWAWTSRPMTTSQSPVAPLMRRLGVVDIVCAPWSCNQDFDGPPSALPLPLPVRAGVWGGADLQALVDEEP